MYDGKFIFDSGNIHNWEKLSFIQLLYQDVKIRNKWLQMMQSTFEKRQYKIHQMMYLVCFN